VLGRTTTGDGVAKHEREGERSVVFIVSHITLLSFAPGNDVDKEDQLVGPTDIDKYLL
jgi:hypothetical protein